MGWGSFTTSWASSMTSGYSGPYTAGQTQTAFGVLPSFSLPTVSPTAPAAGAAPTISLNQPVAEYGRVIPISMGTRRLPPQLIWAKPIYGDATAGFYADFAVAWGFNGDEVPGDTDITVLWANGIKIWNNGTKIMPGAWAVTLYKGTSTQTADATIVAAGGAATGYRDVLYGVFTAFPIGSDFNYGIPGISAEIVGSLGSANAVMLEELINAVGDLAGLDSVSDVSVDASIDDIVDGAVIATETTFDDFTANLGMWFGFDRFEGGSTINFIRPVDGATYTIDATIPASAILNDSEKGIATTRGEDDSPILLSGAYIDQTQQFRYSTQRARRILFPVPSTRSTRETSLAVPIVMTANEAITYLGQAIYRMAQQNVVHTFKLPPRYMYIEPGDILSITAATVVYTVKVTKIEIGPELSISVAAVNLYTDEIMALEGDSGNPLPAYEGTPETAPDVTTFDPDRVPSGHTLTNGNLTVENTSGLTSTTHQQVLRDFDIDGTDKLYVEFVADVIGANNAYVGIVDKDSNFTTWLVGGGEGVGANSGGELFVDSGNVGSGISGGYNDGDVLMIAYAAQKFYYGKNGTWSGGANPATATGGFTVSGAYAGLWRFAVSCRNAGDKFTMRPSLGELQYGPPAGFEPLGFGSEDITPTAFTFTDVSNATLSTVYTSNTITVAGLGTTVQAAISITGGTYAINGGSYVSTAGTVENGDMVAVRVTSSGSASTAVSAVLTIGTVSDTYTVTTAGTALVFDTGKVPTGHTLSNSDKTAQNTSGVVSTSHLQIVRDFNIDGSEKLYWEVVADLTSPGSRIYTGFIGASRNHATDAVGGTWGYAIGHDGTAWTNGGSLGAASSPTFDDGDVLMVAVDCAAQKYYYGKNGTWHGAHNPSAGTGGLSIAGGETGNWRPAVTCRNNTDKFTMRSSGENAYTVPTGFTALS
jgi:hypothetical protein